MRMMKGQMMRSLVVAAVVAVLFSFIQDFIYFDYGRSGVIITQEIEGNLDNMLYKDVKKYIDDNTKKYSVIESIKYILGHYRYLSTWQNKLQTFGLYFFAVFLGCLLSGIKLRKRGMLKTS